ncbi:MAG: folylpolyglutamate synthase/dihydrofolate synthase family protein [Candidatus Omnitrophota bacterium]|jgi:dihydrofolate synthase/folylpolyglutamate synthase
MTYPQALKYLNSLINYEKIPEYPYKESLKLERIRDFLALLGNPQEALKSIHIAGTKGKGSTCAFIAYILKYAGYKVGLYTSPHLSDFRERIRILRGIRAINNPHPEFEGMISKNELACLVKKLQKTIESYNKRSPYGPLSFFEVYTALAFIYFKEKKVDFAVIETGLGGRLDATNTVDPLICAITPISYEHTQKLGNTLKEIAGEKAGIIKSSAINGRTSIVISAPQAKEARDAIRKRCNEKKSRLYEVGKDIRCAKKNGRADIEGIFEKYKDLKISLTGRHQLVNAAVAAGAIETLNFYGINIKKAAIRKGLANTLWPGRCEVVSKHPLILVDGAQNRASAKTLKETLKENFHYNRLILVLGISKDKDIRGVCSELRPLADKVILTCADNPRAASPADLIPYFNGKEAYLTKNLKEAKKLSLSIASGKDLILVTGSLFILGEFRK